MAVSLRRAMIQLWAIRPSVCGPGLKIKKKNENLVPKEMKRVKLSRKNLLKFTFRAVTPSI